MELSSPLTRLHYGGPELDNQGSDLNFNPASECHLCWHGPAGMAWGRVALRTGTAAFQNYCPSSGTGPPPTSSFTNILLACLILITALEDGCHYPFYYGQTECYGPIRYAAGICSEWLVPSQQGQAGPEHNGGQAWRACGQERSRRAVGEAWVPLVRAPRAEAC